MSSSKMDEILRRLERVEEEIRELKRTEVSPNQKIKGPTPDEQRVIEGVKKTLLDVFGEKDRLMVFLALERRLKRPETPEGKPEIFWDTWAIVEPGLREDVNIKRISELLESCSNETRLKILYEVHKAPKYPKELSMLTGLSGGALYHHLDILTEAGLIVRDNANRIVRTVDGELFCDLIFNLDTIGAREEQVTK